jgi:hypothetical protein
MFFFLFFPKIVFFFVFFFVFLCFFSKLYFLIFFFKLSWLKILLHSFFKKKHYGLLQCFPTRFLFCYSASSHVFFLKLSLSIFFNIELVENLALTFPACLFFYFFSFFFALFFPKLSSSFFSFSFFCVFLFRMVFVDFIFLILR